MRVLPLLLLLAACGSDGLDDGWTVSSPDAEGMNAQTLEGARTYAFQQGKNTQGVVIVRHGKIVTEWYREHADAQSPAASWSMAKSVSSSLIGIALDRGLIPSLDAPISDYVPSWQGTDHAPITLRSVLQMSSGLDWLESYAIADYNDSDVIAMVVTGGSQLAVVEGQPVAHPPGEVFNYSSGDAMLLSAVLEGATGESAEQFAQEALFQPLGITGAKWWRDTDDNTLTYCCLDMRSRDFARFGQLYLDGGARDGAQIVPADWVDASLAPSPAYDGYGYMWWLIGASDARLPPDTYAAEGHDGQWIYVIPSEDLVVVRNGIYFQDPGDTVASPDLFDRYPSNGLVEDHGTTPPDEWDDAAFLGPILDSIQ
jgi:CubicO group peptidase (beta-lactamase class C family)